MSTFEYLEETKRFVISHGDVHHVMEDITVSDILSLGYDINEIKKTGNYTFEICIQSKKEIYKFDTTSPWPIEKDLQLFCKSFKEQTKEVIPEFDATQYFTHVVLTTKSNDCDTELFVSQNGVIDLLRMSIISVIRSHDKVTVLFSGNSVVIPVDIPVKYQEHMNPLIGSIVAIDLDEDHNEELVKLAVNNYVKEQPVPKQTNMYGQIL